MSLFTWIFKVVGSLLWLAVICFVLMHMSTPDLTIIAALIIISTASIGIIGLSILVQVSNEISMNDE